MNDNQIKYDEKYLAEKLQEANKLWLGFVSQFLFASDLHKDADKYMVG